MATPLATAFVRIRPDPTGFKRETERESGRAAVGAGKTFGDGFVRAANGRLRDARGKFVAAGSGAGEGLGEGFTRGADGKLRDARGRFVTAGAQAGEGFAAGFSKSAKKAQKGLGDTGVFARVLATAAAKATLFGAAAGSAAPAVLKLVGALAPAAGAAIALPAALGAAAAAVGTVKLATAGVGKAIEEGFTGNAEKAAAAMRKLPPEAREFARSVVGLKGRLTELQRTTADQFFRRFNTQVQPLARAYLPVLNRQVPILAGSMGGLVKQFALAARQGPLLGGVRAVLANTASAAVGLERAVRPVTDAFGRLLTVGAPTVRGLGLSVGDLGVRFGAFIAQAQRTGALFRALEAGKQTLRDLGAITGNVVGIFRSLVSAASAGGNTLLSTFRDLTGQVDDFLASARGMTALRSVFATLAQIGQAIRTALGAALPAVAAALGTLGPSIAQLAGVAAQFVVAFAPLIPAFATVARIALQALIPALAGLARFLTEHRTAMVALVTTLGAFLAVSKVVALVTAVQLAGGMLKWAAATKVGVVATRVATAAQWLFNAALTANPIGIVVVAIAALVAGIVIAYKRSETFRRIVDGALRGVAAAGLWMWNTVLKPTFAALLVAWKAVAAAAVWLWRNILAPAFAGIGAAVGSAWNNIIRPAFTAWTWYIRNVLAPIAMWLWNNIIKPAFAGISWAVRNAWVVIQVALAAWRAYLVNILFPVIRFLWNNVVRPIFSALSAYIKFVWEFIIRPVFNTLRAAFSLVGSNFSAVWNRVIRPTFAAFGGFITGTVAPAFARGVAAIRTAWDKVRDAARIPVTFVVNSVINPLVRGFNRIAGAFGVKDRAHEITGFARGGRIPGAPSARDNRLALGPGGPLRVATGEFITNARQTAANLPLVAAINRARGKVTLADIDPYLDGMADGGIVGRLFGKARAAASSVWDAVIDPAKLIRGPVEAAIGRIPGGGALREMVAGLGRKLVGGLMSWISGAGGGLGGGRAGGWRQMQAMISAQFPGLSLISGFRPGSRTLSGNLSYHAMGRAVDYPPSRALASWIKTRFGANTRELITPFQDLNLLNGRPYHYSGAVWNQHNFAGGNAHVHWAAALGGLVNHLTGGIPVFDRGGTLRPGPNIVMNRTGGYEHLVPAGSRGGGVHLHMHNHGVIGSQRELDTWLVKARDRLRADRRWKD